MIANLTSFIKLNLCYEQHDFDYLLYAYQCRRIPKRINLTKTKSIKTNEMIALHKNNQTLNQQGSHMRITQLYFYSLNQGVLLAVLLQTMIF